MQRMCMLPCVRLQQRADSDPPLRDSSRQPQPTHGLSPPLLPYAGYKWGDQEPPTAAQTPVTKWMGDFLQPGVTHTQAILDLVAWGNAQPTAAGGTRLTHHLHCCHGVTSC